MKWSISILVLACCEMCYGLNNVNIDIFTDGTSGVSLGGEIKIQSTIADPFNVVSSIKWYRDIPDPDEDEFLGTGTTITYRPVSSGEIGNQTLYADACNSNGDPQATDTISINVYENATISSVTSNGNCIRLGSTAGISIYANMDNQVALGWEWCKEANGEYTTWTDYDDEQAPTVVLRGNRSGLEIGKYKFRAKIRGDENAQWVTLQYPLYVYTIDTLTVTDDENANNSVTHSGTTPDTLYIAEAEDGTAKIRISGTKTPNDAPATSFSWSVTGPSASPISGNTSFGSYSICTLTPTDVNRQYTVTVEDKSINVTVIKIDLDGLRVYDPKLMVAGSAQVKYKLTGPSSGFNPRVELTVMDGETEVACLVRKTEDGPVVETEYTKNWDGKWGIKKDGNDTIYKGKYPNPKKYMIEFNIYESNSAASPFCCSKYNMYVVRLGVTEISFEDEGTANEEYDLLYHLKKNTDTDTGTGNDFTLNDPVWKIAANTPADTTDKGDIDKKDGTYRPEAPPNQFLNFPEQDATDTDNVEDDIFNRPVCYKIGSKPQIKVKMGYLGVSQLPGNAIVEVGYGTGTECPDIKIEPANYEDDPSEGNNEDIQPNAEYCLQGTDAAKVGQNGRVSQESLTIDMKFYYKDGAEWKEIPGYQRTTHTLYLVWDTPCGVMVTPWIKVLHRAVEWAQPVIHTHNLGNNTTQGPETHQADNESHIAENTMWNLEEDLHWNFDQGDPDTFEERWRRMTAVAPAATYTATIVMDEPPPASLTLGGDCKSCVHTMADAMTSIGIGPYGPDYVNERSENNFNAANPWGVGYSVGPINYTDGETYFRANYGGGVFNSWQGVCKVGTGGTCYSVQGPHMAVYNIMNDARTEPLLNQTFDNVHAFEWYLWCRSKNVGEAAPYPAGYGEVTVDNTVYIYCTNIPNP